MFFCTIASLLPWWGLAGLAPSSSAESSRNWERLELYQAGEVSWQCSCLIFLMRLSPWLLLFLFVRVLWFKERFGVKVKKCISPRHCLQKLHQTTNVENVLIFPGLLCPCVIVHLLQKAVSVKNGNVLWAEKEEKNADVLFFGFISKDQAMWW